MDQMFVIFYKHQQAFNFIKMKILFSLLLTLSINTLLFSQINCNDFDVDDFVLNGSSFLSGEDEVTLTLAQNNKVGTLWSNQTILFTQDFFIESELFLEITMVEQMVLLLSSSLYHQMRVVLGVELVMQELPLL